MTEKTKDIGERVARLEEGFKNVCQDIKDIKNKLLGRPSWSVTVILSILSTLSVGLIVFIISN